MEKCKKCGRKILNNKKNPYLKIGFGSICGKKEFKHYKDNVTVSGNNHPCQVVVMNERFIKIFPSGIKSFREYKREELEKEAYIHYFLQTNKIKEIPEFQGLCKYKLSVKVTDRNSTFVNNKIDLGIKMECLIKKREVKDEDIPEIVKILNKILKLNILLTDVLETINPKDDLKKCLVNNELEKLKIRNNGNIIVTTEGIKIIDFGINNVETDNYFFEDKDFYEFILRRGNE